MTCGVNENSPFPNYQPCYGMVGEYSQVALATIELPRDPASVQGSIVADATVKIFHAHHGLMVFEEIAQPA
jgi:hypothetical protein